MTNTIQANSINQFIINMPDNDSSHQVLKHQGNGIKEYQSATLPMSASMLKFFLQYFDLEDLEPIIDYLKLHINIRTDLGYYTTHTVRESNDDLLAQDIKRMYIVSMSPEGETELLNFDIFNISVIKPDDKYHVILNGITYIFSNINSNSDDPETSKALEDYNKQVLNSFLKTLDRNINHTQQFSAESRNITYKV